MKETNFINQNKDKWADGESLIQKGEPNPKVLSDAFVEVSEDLSYSRTFYPHRGIRIYLNRFVQALFFKIDKRKMSTADVKLFWTDKVPFAMYESRKDMRLALFIFLTGLIIGITSNIYDPEFARLILGDGYVDMTLENIAKGDPVAVYKSSDAFDMFFRITLNNLMVAYRTFVMGIVFSVGSGLILFYNAVMVGSFQTFFFQHEVGFESMLGIWLHGTLEISAIVLAGGAGLTLGRGLLFPGTFTRFEAFQMSAQRGVKVMLGITPIFILAGFIEGFATRFTHAPTPIRLLIIGGSLFFILGYYVWIPFVKGRKGFPKSFYRFTIPPSPDTKIELNSIKSVTELIASGIKLITEMGVKPIFVSIGAALIFTSSFLYTNWDEDMLSIISVDSVLSNVYRYFTYYEFNLGFLLNWALFVATFAIVLWEARNVLQPEIKFGYKSWLKLGLFTFLWTWLFMLPEIHSWYVILFTTPFIFMMIAGSFNLSKHQLSWSQLASISITQYFKSLGYYLSLAVFAFVGMSIVYSPLLWMYMQIIQMNIKMEGDTVIILVTSMVTFILSFIFFFVFQVVFSGLIVGFYANMEAKYAFDLRDKIGKITAKKYAYGLERESE